MRDTTGAILGCVLASVIVVVLAVADAATFEDAEFSPLYRFTLDRANSRFKDSDRNIPARGPVAAAGQREGRDPGPIFGAGGEARGLTPGVRGGLPAIPPAGVQGPSLPGWLAQSPLQRIAGSAAPRAVHDHNGANMQQAERHAASGQLEQALALFRLALRDQPGCALAHHRIADVLQQQGKSDEAITEYREALRLDSGYECAEEHIGDVLLGQGKASEAEHAFTNVIAAYRRSVAAAGPAGVVAQYKLANFFLNHNRELQEAVRLARGAADSTPPQATNYLLLARCYEATGQPQEALQALDRAIELSPEENAYLRDYRKRLTETGITPAGETEEESTTNEGSG